MKVVTVFDIEVSAPLVKGFVHAIVIPILLAVLTFTIEQQFTMISGAAYLFFATCVYTLKRNSDFNDQGAEWFFEFAKLWLLFLVFIAYIIMMGAVS